MWSRTEFSALVVTSDDRYTRCIEHSGQSYTRRSPRTEGVLCAPSVLPFQREGWSRFVALIFQQPWASLCFSINIRRVEMTITRDLTVTRYPLWIWLISNPGGGRKLKRGNLSDERMRFDVVCLILELDLKKWPRLHLPVNLAHTSTKVPWLSQRSGKEARVLLYHWCTVAAAAAAP